MVGIAEHLGSAAIWGDVPGVEVRNRSDRARSPVHHAERAGPDGEHDISASAEKSLVHNELVIAVLVEAFHAAAVAPNAVHAGRGISGEDEPLGFQWMKLRVD